jgi:hypothetical protein
MHANSKIALRRRITMQENYFMIRKRGRPNGWISSTRCAPALQVCSDALHDVSQGPSDDEFSEHSSIDEMFGGSDALHDVSRGPSDDEFSEHSSIDEMFGGSDTLHDVSRGPSDDEFSEHCCSIQDEMFGDIQIQRSSVTLLDGRTDGRSI